MKTLKQMLASKDRPLAVVAPSDTVFHALSVMAKHDVGALLVLDGEQLVGIFSERDYARKIILHGKTSKDTQVREIMSDKVAYVTPAASLDECMALMTEKHFRHLPVLNDDSSVAGMISIGDLVKETISSQQFLIAELERYISG
ncbi:CBS domain-containing protein [Dechloromonas sp. TW-R-39-2]|uniref:CBS domain-containing protein n=1 Tax=Dechloromonas sp. TW-R-39-2 TaxID=2654218 RepID=UPI00193E89D8|nr:CBS domain-containing protein [Dechloromonas sp. TW-R-39-2]QRM18816.1 CBS domain-containing protein [Dechloromonas sp. TW-R-39-2]